MPLDVRLTHYEQTLDLIHGDPVTYDVIVYEDGTTVLVKRPTPPWTIRQSGEATTMEGVQFVPPEPMFPQLVEPPQTTRVPSENGFIWKVTWSYVMVVEAGAIEAELFTITGKVPEDPQFILGAS